MPDRLDGALDIAETALKSWESGRDIGGYEHAHELGSALRELYAAAIQDRQRWLAHQEATLTDGEHEADYQARHARDTLAETAEYRGRGAAEQTTAAQRIIKNVQAERDAYADKLAAIIEVLKTDVPLVSLQHFARSGHSLDGALVELLWAKLEEVQRLAQGEPEA